MVIHTCPSGHPRTILKNFLAHQQAAAFGDFQAPTPIIEPSFPLTPSDTGTTSTLLPAPRATTVVANSDQKQWSLCHEAQATTSGDLNGGLLTIAWRFVWRFTVEPESKVEAFFLCAARAKAKERRADPKFHIYVPEEAKITVGPSSSSEQIDQKERGN